MIASSKLTFEDMDALQAGFGSEQGQAAVNDIPNFATGGVTIFFADRLTRSLGLLARPAGPAARPQPALSIGGALPSPLLFPREVSLLAKSHLEEDQQQGRAEAERDQRDGQRIARRPADQGRADRAGDD